MTWRVLVVDDEPDVRTLLGALLRDPEIHVDMAHRVGTALEFTHRFRYDLAIVDYMLPGETGAEFIRATRVPCIALTALASQTNVVDDLYLAGCSTVIAKPFNIDHLLMLVNRALGRTPG